MEEDYNESDIQVIGYALGGRTMHLKCRPFVLKVFIDVYNCL